MLQLWKTNTTRDILHNYVYVRWKSSGLLCTVLLMVCKFLMTKAGIFYPGVPAQEIGGCERRYYLRSLKSSSFSSKKPSNQPAAPSRRTWLRDKCFRYVLPCPPSRTLPPPLRARNSKCRRAFFVLSCSCDYLAQLDALNLISSIDLHSTSFFGDCANFITVEKEIHSSF